MWNLKMWLTAVIGTYCGEAGVKCQAVHWLRQAFCVLRHASKDAPKYSRLEAEISAMQRNSSTYCDQPEDTDDFSKWLKVRCLHLLFPLL